jgi:hypothetical protein
LCAANGRGDISESDTIFSLGEVLLLLVEEFLLMKLCVNSGGEAGVYRDFVRKGFIYRGFKISLIEVL